MAIVRYRALQVAACFTLVGLAACAQEGQDEMSWARAALARNDRIEVVGADQQTRTFTVRVKDTGELRVLCAQEGQDEMSWARAALARNDRIEVVGADQQTRTFTVRVKDTGELRVLRADQLIA